MRVLSIQSAVTYGHVGNSAAVFPLQRLGHEAMPIYTVTFSNHTGYGHWRGRVAAADEIREIVTGVDERGQLGAVDMILSGYLGNPDIADVIIETVQKVKQKNPDARYALDPVMGNAETGCVVDPSIPRIIKERALSVADIVSPNQFELGFLTDTEPHTLPEILDSVALLQERGPHTVLVTSVKRPDRPEGTLEVLAVDGDSAWIVQTPQLPITLSGTGDTVMSLFIGNLGNTGSVATALENAVSGVYGVLEETLAAGEHELRLVEAQDRFAHPRREFTARQVK
ncbi:MAG TPA: pyridoxal kinase PdxY [Pseudoclavibacter sp.]|nr:pyridoxal kinase PdxY [Pseudoclavibacter sp.]